MRVRGPEEVAEGNQELEATAGDAKVASHRFKKGMDINDTILKGILPKEAYPQKQPTGSSNYTIQSKSGARIEVQTRSRCFRVNKMKDGMPLSKDANPSPNFPWTPRDAAIPGVWKSIVEFVGWDVPLICWPWPGATVLGAAES